MAKVRPGGHAYYLDVVRAGVEPPGTWLSAGAAELGLGGTATSEQFETLLSGADPRTGERLGVRHDRVKVAAFDLTFCAPKSVSLLFALSDHDVSAAVRLGHEEAVKNTLSYIEDHALAVRRGPRDERAVEPAGGVAGAGFLHRMSRALDPHLHTHVVVANLGRGADLTWSALDGRGAYAHASAAAALYHAHLRFELTSRLGVEWGPVDRGRADIAGIGAEVRRAFSRRSSQIEAHLVELGIAAPGRRARSVAAVATRADRDPDVTPESLMAEWRRRASAVGLTPRLLESTLERVRASAAPKGSRIDPPARRREVDTALSNLNRGVTRRDVLREWCWRLARGGAAGDVQRVVDDHVAELPSAQGHRTGRDGIGVAENRHVVEVPALQRAASDERRRLERFLARSSLSFANERGLSLAVEEGIDLGR